VASAACGFGVACPLLSIAALLLGFRALYHIREVPGRRGRRLALTGLVLGAIGTALWTGGAFWWDRNARKPMLVGPAAQLTAGFAGDVEGFAAGFRGATGAEAEGRLFLEELTRRYGAYVGIERGESERRPGPALVDGRVTLPYELEFAWQPIEAQATFVVYEPGDNRLVLEFETIEVIDAERGNLAFPAGALGDGG
jgi:hypothetical protein